MLQSICLSWVLLVIKEGNKKVTTIRIIEYILGVLLLGLYLSWDLNLSISKSCCKLVSAVVFYKCFSFIWQNFSKDFSVKKNWSQVFLSSSADENITLLPIRYCSLPSLTISVILGLNCWPLSCTAVAVMSFSYKVFWKFFLLPFLVSALLFI